MITFISNEAVWKYRKSKKERDAKGNNFHIIDSQKRLRFLYKIAAEKFTYLFLYIYAFLASNIAHIWEEFAYTKKNRPLSSLAAK